ncbi:MAG: winged helix-turn-helix domain-containing protein [Xanthobacteraceae bacterium]|nr:winged helix-turn-helix domain-containing protein [Xanthobacteraceae bacterium]
MNTFSDPRVLKDGGKTAEIALNSGQRAAAVAHPAMPGPGRLGFDRYVLDLERGCLLAGDEEVSLRPKTFEVLRYLVGNAGRLVSKGELIHAIWPTVTVTDDSLFQCIAELRRALQDNDQRLIRTVQRRGYRFEGAVQYSEVAAPGHTDGVSVDGKAGWTAFQYGRGDHRTILVAAACVLAIIFAGFFAGRRLPDDRFAPTTSVSLVVLPFRSVGGDLDQGHFAVGIAMDLTTDLSRIPGTTVIAPATAQTFKGNQLDPRQVARELNVRYLLDGSVQRTDNEVRINVQLKDAATGAHLWAERFTRGRDQLAGWQDEVVGRIASALNLRLPRLENERALRERRGNADAYDLATRGWALIYTAKKAEHYETALALFREALARDPSAMSAMAGVAWSSGISLLNGWSASPAEDTRIAKAAIAELLAVDPHHVVAHHSRGFLLRLQQRTSAAHDTFQTVVSINPNFAPGHAQLGLTAIELGRPDEAIPSIERAIRLSPRDPNLEHWFGFIGMAEFHRGNLTAAVSRMARAINGETSTPTALQHAYYVSALALAGRAAEAEAALTEFLRQKPGASIPNLRKAARSKDPNFSAQQERLYEGLRAAGLPE